MCLLYMMDLAQHAVALGRTLAVDAEYAVYRSVDGYVLVIVGFIDKEPVYPQIVKTDEPAPEPFDPAILEEQQDNEADAAVPEEELSDEEQSEADNQEKSMEETQEAAEAAGVLSEGEGDEI